MKPIHLPAERLGLLFEWAQLHRGRRLGLWLLVAVALHAGVYLLFRIEYPAPRPARIEEAAIYLLPPRSDDARRLGALLDSSDPALFAPERNARAAAPAAPIPSYTPSFLAARPELEPPASTVPRVLPPLPRDLGPVPMPESPAPAHPLPPPATRTELEIERPLDRRRPDTLPPMDFEARPGDQLPPSEFLIAVAPDGRTLHVLHEGTSINPALDDEASRYLMALWFHRGANSDIVWARVRFHWGLDLQRVEPRTHQEQSPP